MAEELFYSDAWMNTNPSRDQWIRVSTQGLFRFNPATQEYDLPQLLPQSQIDGLLAELLGKAESSHSHAALGNINFTGTVSADGDAGLTGQRTIGGYTLTFKKGLLTGFTAV